MAVNEEQYLEENELTSFVYASDSRCTVSLLHPYSASIFAFGAPEAERKFATRNLSSCAMLLKAFTDCGNGYLAFTPTTMTPSVLGTIGPGVYMPVDGQDGAALVGNEVGLHLPCNFRQGARRTSWGLAFSSDVFVPRLYEVAMHETVVGERLE